MTVITPRQGLLALALAFAAALPAAAVDVAGVRIDDSAKVAGKELRLNGAGVRTQACSRSTRWASTWVEKGLARRPCWPRPVPAASPS
ncbi:MAG: chalcone isomerase family protein [Rubrivivax sp.]